MSDPIPLPPAEFIESVGGGDFAAIGAHLLQVLCEHTGLQPTDAILDIGCGCGRLAIPLTGYLSAGARYHGFDVVPEMIEWCRRNISSRYDSFSFHTARLRNTLYSRTGGLASEYRFPFGDETFDVAVATSVFTHLVPESALQYARESARVLKAGGRALFTFYLMRDDYEDLRRAGKTKVDFDQRWGSCWVTDSSRPEAVICYDEREALALLQDGGLQVSEISRGWWVSAEGWTYQDCILATR